MSEPIAERLSRFTPDRSGLDRDALLFAAGRASARPGRCWPALAGALALSQLLTLAFLWPQPVPPTEPSVARSAPAPEPPPSPAPAASSLWELREAFLETGQEPAPQRPVTDLGPDPPPLRVFPISSDWLVN